MPLLPSTYIYHEAELNRFIPQLWTYLQDYAVVGLVGELGSGKTTFVRALGQFLGVKQRISSPTFSLMHEYDFWEKSVPRKIYHMDWYRLKDERELADLDLEFYWGKGYCWVEWIDKFPRIWASKDRVDIVFSSAAQGLKRQIVLKKPLI